jgi:putative transposase
MRSAIKIRLVVDPPSAAVLDGQSRILNWLYNLLVDVAGDLRHGYIANPNDTTGHNLYTKRGFRNMLPALKAQFPFLRTVHSSPVKNAALRLAKAIGDHQDCAHGRRKGKPVSWPHFRSWKRKWFSLLYDEPGKGFSLVGDLLTVTLGVDAQGKRLSVQARLAEPLPRRYTSEDIRNLRIVRDGTDFHAVFAVERGLPEGKPIFRAIALDPNHKNLAYGVDAEGTATQIANPWFAKLWQRRTCDLKSRRDSCKKQSVRVIRPDGSWYWRPSRRWLRFDRALAEVHRLRREQTKAYLFTMANRLFRKYDLVAVGDYTPHGGGITPGMRRAMNNESLIGRFKEVLSWVAMKSGKRYDEWREAGSTRTCCECGQVVEGGISPDIREWDCPRCNAHHIRDENAARNGLMRVLIKNPLPCSGRLGGQPVAVLTRRTWRFSGLGVVETPGV